MSSKPNAGGREWFELPESAHETNVERIEEVNDALANGSAVMLVNDYEHESRSTVLYFSDEHEALIWSAYVADEGGRRTFGYSRDAIDQGALMGTEITIAWADERRICDVSETPLHHATYGVNPESIR